MMVVILYMKSPTVSLCLLAALTSFSCSKTKVAPASEVAPATFRVNVDTTRGPLVIEVTRADAPLGADRFYNLVKAKFFDGARFFRVVPGFIVQFGLADDPAVTAAWDVPVKDDPVLVGNSRGTIAFAAAGPDTRTTQMFINTGDNRAKLDGQASHFATFGKVVSGMDCVDSIFSGYAEKPQQDRIEKEGNAYLSKEFPSLDYIKTARLAQ
jgi:peptidyl-prolyl cis-trans isomerase A (cyclophilin A)